ncbi:putative coatomer beta subunit (COPB1), AP complex subunit beta protein [Rosa chinensis]|uniref:Putative coatomer beta subunit (COPB1), AP complex subunit beta protein n=1 Tax=Rosa chinensis TaxID=74649 RepID=A0A2P6RWI4_ROSCH|nr:putative coatomer beta subunit (COPB1), AP complex subunit beta protein [Rosa chinensis]
MLPSTQLKINNHAIRHQSLSHPDLSPSGAVSLTSVPSLSPPALSLSPSRRLSRLWLRLSLLRADSLSPPQEALKRLLALIAHGFNVSNFFPQVVKNVATQSLEVKRLVYLYLLHYAQKRPNEALLLINCFQKDLGDPNPLVMAWALLAMARIRLHVIAPLVVVAMGKCARDPSVYV